TLSKRNWPFTWSLSSNWSSAVASEKPLSYLATRGVPDGLGGAGAGAGSEGGGSAGGGSWARPTAGETRAAHRIGPSDFIRLLVFYGRLRGCRMSLPLTMKTAISARFVA